MIAVKASASRVRYFRRVDLVAFLVYSAYIFSYLRTRTRAINLRFSKGPQRFFLFLRVFLTRLIVRTLRFLTNTLSSKCASLPAVARRQSSATAPQAIKGRYRPCPKNVSIRSNSKRYSGVKAKYLFFCVGSRTILLFTLEYIRTGDAEQAEHVHTKYES